MRSAAITLVLLAACKPGGVGETQELCAKAAAMYDRCETDEGSSKLDRDLELDRWRSLCRAVITGDTDQMLPDTLQLYATMDEETKAGLKLVAECQAKATTCEAYTACND